MRNINFISDLIFLLIIFIIKILKIFIPIRINRSYSSRLGHFVGINSLHIYNINKKYYDFFILDEKISNSEIYKLFKEKLVFIPKFLSKFFHKVHDVNLRYKIIKKLSFHYDKKFNLRRQIFECRDVLNLIDTKKTNFGYKKKDEKKILIENKINFDLNKIICIHVRDEGYLTKNFKNYNERKLVNVKISTYLKTISKLIKLGYTIIRVGKDHKNFLNYKNKNYIDLYQKGVWNDKLELFLIYKCVFFIGTHSGGSMSPLYLFKKPTLFTNFLPIGKLFSYSKSIIFIPKKIKFNNKYLSLKKIFVNKFSFFEKSKDIKKHKMKIVDNTANEIYYATLDMLEFLKNKNNYLKKNRYILLKHKKIYQDCIKNSYIKKYHGQIRANISPSFVKRNKFFLKN